MAVSRDSDEPWRPTATRAMLAARAQLLARIRAYFAHAGVLEVETPALSQAATTDPRLHSLETTLGAQARYLHTSPEFPMKRLLAAGSGSIYQICKAFRADEQGRRHNPEFTLLEWYRVGWNYRELMTEVGALINACIDVGSGAAHPLQAPEFLTYREAFNRHAGIDAMQANAREFAACARAHAVHAPALGDTDVDAWRDLILTHVIEPRLGDNRLTFLYDYPASQAALARVRADTPPVAERFEVYLAGMELANGFQELTDAHAQAGRFAHDNALRVKLGLATMPVDTRFIAALAHGLPDCAGVALGVDRLLMAAVRADRIDAVLAFPSARA